MTDEELLARVRDVVLPVPRPAPPPPPGKRAAAVLILIDPATQGLPLLFMVRSAHMRNHPGQIAFPGGGIEASDADVAAAALREATEEVGLPTDNVDVIGSLPSLLTAVSDMWLTPVVGLQRNPWRVVPDGVEVAEWFRTGLQSLRTAPHRVERMTRDGVARDVHFYDVDGRMIWGVTGAIVDELLRRIG